jgi:hypothetical protein
MGMDLTLFADYNIVAIFQLGYFMNKYAISCFLMVLILTLACLGNCLADDSVASKYLHFRNLLSTPPGTVANLQADQNSTPQKARYYEFAGQIVGQVTSDNQPIVLIDCQNQSFEVAASPSFFSSTDWMDSGSIVRVLVKSVPSADGSGSSSGLMLICAAPESSVSSLERKLATDEAEIQARVRLRLQGRSSVETSRSASTSMRFVNSNVPVDGLSERAAAIYPAYCATIARLNPSLSDTDVATITKSILYYSDAYQIDPRLIVAMVIAESGFDPNSVSRTGAVGLGQLMPGTAAGLGVTDAFDPVQNIAASVALLSRHVQHYGGAPACGIVPINTLLLSMAAYNAGPGAVKKYGGVPPYKETQNYVRKVRALYKQLCGI